MENTKLQNEIANKQKSKPSTLIFKLPPHIIGRYVIVGTKESQGPFKNYFKHPIVEKDFIKLTYEQAECKILEETIFNAIHNAKLTLSDIDVLVSGDLLNQITSSSFAARKFDTSFIGLYGACSTMAESLAIGSCLLDGGYFKRVACSTSSHFATAERQYRAPLELGTPRTPTSQWTVTATACSVLSASGNGPIITSATFGKVTDFGIADPNNMGVAMAPAAMTTLVAHLANTHTKPEDYDLILTGDLGKLGSDVFVDLMEQEGYKLGQNYSDGGHMMFDINQKTNQGGSGCGCGASLLNSYVLDKINDGKYKKVLFMATGALLNSLTSQQGETIPCIAHSLVIEKGD